MEPTLDDYKHPRVRAELRAALKGETRPGIVPRLAQDGGEGRIAEILAKKGRLSKGPVQDALRFELERITCHDQQYEMMLLDIMSRPIRPI